MTSPHRTGTLPFAAHLLEQELVAWFHDTGPAEEGRRDRPPGSRLPATFGNYSIVSHLATGGMAEVYVARQTGLAGFERLVVIKRIRPDLLGDLGVIASLIDEARLLATLQHPNIAQVHDIGRVNDLDFIVMEYVPGADLRQVVDRACELGHQITIADAIYIAIQACTALHYAHDKRDAAGRPLGIIHRDISPSNVLLSHDGAVKICDFGIAKTLGRALQTAAGTLKGKYGYMSPEQCRCLTLDRRSDVFSLGIVLYELTTMTRAFPNASEYELLRAITEGPPPPPSSRVRGYPPDLERIVMRALATDPAARYPTTQAMQLELEALARDQRLPVSSVNLARLMTELFDTPPASPPGAVLDAIADHPARAGESAPGFARKTRLGLGSNVASGARRTRSNASPRPAGAAPAAAPPARRPSALWLAAAIVAGCLATGVALAGRTLDRASATTAAAALDADAERIAAALEVSHRLVRGRAAGIAAMPILRVAIETDADTLRDIAEHEAVFAIEANETLEIFQIRGDEPIPLLHIPAASPHIARCPRGTTSITAADSIITVVASAAVERASATGAAAPAGEVTVAARVDLASAISSLEQHADAASLRGPGIDVRLVGSPGSPYGAPRTIPLAFTGELRSRELVLVATPATPPSIVHRWVAPAWIASLVLGAWALASYLLRRRPQDSRSGYQGGPTGIAT